MVSLFINISQPNTGFINLWIQKNVDTTPVLPLISTYFTAEIETKPIVYRDVFTLQSGDKLNICAQDSIGVVNLQCGQANLVIQPMSF